MTADRHRAQCTVGETECRGATLIAIDIASGTRRLHRRRLRRRARRHTLTFGSVKRGQLLRRDLTGELHVLDIGLVECGRGRSRAWSTRVMCATWIPPLAADAWKGTRGRLAIVGGDAGMAGAVIIAARGAHASGVGHGARRCCRWSRCSRCRSLRRSRRCTRGERNDCSQIDTAWPRCDGDRPRARWHATRQCASRSSSLLHAFDGPVVLDAGALTCILLVRRPGESTSIDVADGTDGGIRWIAAPRAARHAPRCSRRTSASSAALLRTGHGDGGDRFDDPSVLARRLDATVLLKGVPTIIAAPDGETLCVRGRQSGARDGRHR